MNKVQEFDKARLNPESLMQTEICIQSQISSQNQQIRCKICYDTYTPLVSLCNCNGSIGFVHQGCILDWITKKMEVSQNVEIPYCQICHARYSARMSIGRKKICFSTLKQKIIGLKYKGVLDSIFYLLGLIMAILIIISGFISIFGYTKNIFEKDLKEVLYDGWVNVFIYLLFPLFFLKATKKHWRKRKYLIQSSMVQIVQVTLLPKITIGSSN